MHRSLPTLAILSCMMLSISADEPPTRRSDQKESQSHAVKSQARPLKKTADPLPEGVLNFNGMLVGRLAAKDVEKGSFVVQVDAVPRVWRNSKAESPRSFIGKAVEVSGVFGKFLDVLVVTRIGDTLEFECKHDGDGLVFPGELLRKVAAYDPADYPTLPEKFRGFQGKVAGKIIKKDPETFELIFEVDRVINQWDSNRAKAPLSIEGKRLMLAGFWNRKDQYHALKVGDRVEVGMKHIGMRSEHMTVAEDLRKVEKENERSLMQSDDAAQIEDGLDAASRGFRGMLVGRLLEKDVERGTFKIKVDAVPRVWKNSAATRPKSLLGSEVTAEGVTGKRLDVLVVTKTGQTIQFGAFHEGGNRMRVVEELRKVAPVKPGDYPVLPDGFRGFRGMVTAKVVGKDVEGMELVVEVQRIQSTFPASRAKDAKAMLGQRAMLVGFWKRKDTFHKIQVGDTLECGIEHPQLLGDQLGVIESVKILK